MRIPLIGLALIVTAAMNTQAQTSRATLAPASKLWIEGTSNVHDWKCEATGVDAVIDLDAAGLAAAPSQMVKKVSVRIPVSGLKCGHGKMDENLQKALKAEKNPEISYTLTTIEALAGAAKDDFTLRAIGRMNIAGTEGAVTIDVAATRQPDGTIRAAGTVPVKMSAFGVKPPTAMLGAIKTGDEVKVRFELVVGPKVVATTDK